MNKIEVNIEDDPYPLFASLKENKIIEAVDKILKLLSLNDSEISLYFCNNSIIKGFNLLYRKKDEPTDVLSFEGDGDGIYLGDIAISVERAKEQLEEFGSPTLDYEILRLLIHGILHLIGYDHEKDEKEAEIMRNKEEDLLLEVQKLTLYQD